MAFLKMFLFIENNEIENFHYPVYGLLIRISVELLSNKCLLKQTCPAQADQSHH